MSKQSRTPGQTATAIEQAIYKASLKGTVYNGTGFRLRLKIEAQRHGLNPKYLEKITGLKEPPKTKTTPKSKGPKQLKIEFNPHEQGQEATG